MPKVEKSGSPEWGERFHGYQTRRKLGRFALSVMRSEAVERVLVPEDWWEAQHAAAYEFLISREHKPKTLIVVAAQHPLKDGLYPNDEFAARLEVAHSKALALHNAGEPVELYVPGSRHQHQGVEDEIALAEAGEAWLRAHGLPPEITVHAAAANERHKGADGVYNGADEAYVASAIFKDDDEFGMLHVVCAPGQAIRWELHALANGVTPSVQTVGVSGGMYHSDAAEQDRLVNYTRFIDPTWQSKTSLMGALTRRLRRPRG